MNARVILAGLYALSRLVLFRRRARAQTGPESRGIFARSSDRRRSHRVRRLRLCRGKPEATPRSIEAAERIEGEKRFRTNCGRCHQAPHKFPPRVMATVIRHMRVRAMITDEDTRLILRYMTQ